MMYYKQELQTIMNQLALSSMALSYVAGNYRQFDLSSGAAREGIRKADVTLMNVLRTLQEVIKEAEDQEQV